MAMSGSQRRNVRVTVFALAGVVVAAYRRLVIRPARLTLSRTGLIILLFIFLVVSTEFFALVFEAVAFGAISGAFITNALAVPLAGMDEETAHAIFAALWWALTQALTMS